MTTFYAVSATKLVHILSICIWFGTKLLVPADIRRAIADGNGAMDSAIRRVNLVQKVAISASMVTLASGLAMIWQYGGFGAVPTRIHVGFALTLALFALGAFGVDKAWKKIRDAVKRGVTERAELSRLERRLSVLMTVENVIWCGVLFLMVFRLELIR